MWRSEGTEATTELVADLYPGPGDSFPARLVSSGAVLYLVADDRDHGRELWAVFVNRAPDPVLAGPFAGSEGSPVRLYAGGSSDPDGDTLLYRWDFDGDGAWDTARTTESTASHTWYDDHVGVVAVEVFDGSVAVTASAEIEIVNVAPSISALAAALDPVAVGTAVTLSGEFTDPGMLDTHGAVVSWGDGSSSPASVAQASGDGTATAQHTYVSPGIYTLTLTVTDDDGAGTSAPHRYVVVYDPTGDFVTGAGRIASPEGAHPDDPQLISTASFAVVASYTGTEGAPTGTLVFTLPAAALEFRSTAYDWLVPAGSRAWLQGRGEINGAGDFGFLLGVVDGDLPGGDGADRLRIKIWNRDQDGRVVYDNLMGAAHDAVPIAILSQGAITIH